MEKKNDAKKSSTGQVKADKARIDRLKEQLRSTPAEVDFERIRIMEEVYAATQGDQNIMRRAKFMATLLERKKLYIDDNLFVGSMASTVNGIYTYPEWNIDWMKDDNTVEKCKDPEDKRVNQWALDYWEKRALKPRTLEIFEKKYGFDPRPCYDSGFVVSFFDWPGGGGNLNYPRIYNHGLAAMIKEVEERQAALDMRLPNASKLYFYEASLILMRSIVRLANRYAELAREMAAKEKDATRKAELIAIAETCEWVPEHPARNLREAIQCHFFCHLCAELEQVGCGYSEAYLGQNLEPYYQARQGGRADRSGGCDVHAPEPLHQAERNRLLLWREGRLAELCRPGSEHLARRLYRGWGGCHRGNGLSDPRCLRLPSLAAASADLRLHGADERQIPGKGPGCHRHRCRHASVREWRM